MENWRRVRVIDDELCEHIRKPAKLWHPHQSVPPKADYFISHSQEAQQWLKVNEISTVEQINLASSVLIISVWITGSCRWIYYDLFCLISPNTESSCCSSDCRLWLTPTQSSPSAQLSLLSLEKLHCCSLPSSSSLTVNLLQNFQFSTRWKKCKLQQIKSRNAANYNF